MTKADFIKMSGAGNDFVIIDIRKRGEHFSDPQIAAITDRKNIGCDQLIILNHSQAADITMEIFNSDGTKSKACGNATRCVAALMMEEKKRDDVQIETDAGVLKCWREGELIAVNMGQPEFDWAKIPLAKPVNVDSFNLNDEYLRAYELSAVSMGNPHAVTFINQKIDDREFSLIAPLIEKNSLFPERTNVEFARFVALDHINVRVWERGAGETLACGSGACAVGVIAIKKGLISKARKVRISFKGGDLFVEWKADNSVIMTGGYKKIFAGKIFEEFLDQ